LLSGLSIPALRHYDEVGLLAPARVDLPLGEIREVLAGPDSSAVLRRHRERLVERAEVVSQMVGSVDQFLREGSDMTVKEGNRMVQVTVGAPDLSASIGFHSDVFGVDAIIDDPADNPIALYQR